MGRTLTSVQQRWPMGLGKYLLAKVETNMQKSGILEGPSPRQVQELRVCQCPTSWFVLQAVRLCWSCCQDDLLPSHPYWHGRQGRQEGQGIQECVHEAP